MPRYDFACDKCGNEQEIVLPLASYRDTIRLNCTACGPQGHTLVVHKVATEDWSHGGSGRHFEELSPKGETFHSKGEYKKYLKERGIVEWSPKRGMPGCDP